MLEQNIKQSRTEREIQQKIRFIYEHLVKLGYAKILELSLSSIQQIQSYLSAYFQCTPSRLQLIQWLIAIVFPQYRQISWYITEKDHLIKITKCLWKIGVMPVNKHTKNLDYKKYVQATIGYENAVGLIFSLVQLAYQTVLSQKAKNDVAFGQFFHQLVDNFTELVNENYDVYGITFPSKFVNLNQVKQSIEEKDETEQHLDEFEKQYNQFYKQKMITLLQKEDELFDKIYANKKTKNPIQMSLPKNKAQQNTNHQNNPTQLQQFVDNLAKYGRQYHDKYTNLIENIDKLLSTPQTKSRLIPYYLGKKQSSAQQPSVKQSIQNRSIRISPAFCQKYQNYKKILRQIKTPKDDPEFMGKKTQILEQLCKINENIRI